MRVLLSEEYPERERLSLLLLDHFLREAGHEVGFTNSWELERDFNAFRPDVVADNISDCLAHYVGKLGMLNEHHRNVNLMWEQLPNPVNLLRYKWDQHFYMGYVDGRLAWGDAFRDLLCVENPGLDPGRVRPSGSMKHAVYELLREVDPADLLPLYPDDYSGWERIVVYADPLPYASWDIEAFRLKGPLFDKVPYLYELCLFARRAKEASLTMIKRLAEARPEYLFVIRTHPGKVPDYYQSFQARFEQPNVRIDYAGDIGGLLRISDLLLSTRSGTLVDAYFVGTPGVNILCRDDPFAPTGLLRTFEMGFGHTLWVDELTPSTLDDSFALPVETDERTRWVSEWFESTDLRTFQNTVRFMEDVAAMPPMRKRIPVRQLASPAVAKRKARNALRSMGLGIRGRHTHAYPYERIYELLASAHGLGGAS